MKEKSKGILIGALIGGIAGSVTALLFAPKAGKELRQDIADGARQVGGKVQEVAGKVGEQGIQLIGTVTDRAEGVISDIQAWKNKKEASYENEGREAQVSSAKDHDFEDQDVFIKS
ncbi:YtxH domain-containing protein [Paenibacillus faecalis]|uniref:YtxH domain-containing protein n=1 Tax=Paenibacillus faecalis TaxID=2079532 RepID=UPI000D114B23|nr:YtxH domain-containing protein [Paenibacillus faecalis]